LLVPRDSTAIILRRANLPTSHRLEGTTVRGCGELSEVGVDDWARRDGKLERYSMPCVLCAFPRRVPSDFELRETDIYSHGLYRKILGEILRQAASEIQQQRCWPATFWRQGSPCCRDAVRGFTTSRGECAGVGAKGQCLLVKMVWPQFPLPELCHTKKAGLSQNNRKAKRMFSKPALLLMES
jgi:hypothetical protein